VIEPDWFILSGKNPVIRGKSAAVNPSAVVAAEAHDDAHNYIGSSCLQGKGAPHAHSPRISVMDRPLFTSRKSMTTTVEFHTA
jgi:hypothetical protein